MDQDDEQEEEEEEEEEEFRDGPPVLTREMLMDWSLRIQEVSRPQYHC
jgi:hypothetical protein